MTSSLISSSFGPIPADLLQSARPRLIAMNYKAMKAIVAEMDCRARINALLDNTVASLFQIDRPQFTVTHLPDAPNAFQLVPPKPRPSHPQKPLSMLVPQSLVAQPPTPPASSTSSSAPQPQPTQRPAHNPTQSAPAKTLSPTVATTSSASSSAPAAQSIQLAPAKTSPAPTTSSASSSAPATPSVVNLPTAPPSKIIQTVLPFNPKKIMEAYSCLKKMQVLSCNLKRGGVQGPNGSAIEYVVPGEVRLAWSIKQQGRTIQQKHRLYDLISSALSELITNHFRKKHCISMLTAINDLRPNERNTHISLLGTEWFWIQSGISDTKKLYKRIFTEEEAVGCPIEQRISWIDGTQPITLIPTPNDNPPDLSPFLAWLKTFQGVSKTV